MLMRMIPSIVAAARRVPSLLLSEPAEGYDDVYEQQAAVSA